MLNKYYNRITFGRNRFFYCVSVSLWKFFKVFYGNIPPLPLANNIASLRTVTNRQWGITYIPPVVYTNFCFRLVHYIIFIIRRVTCKEMDRERKIDFNICTARPGKNVLGWKPRAIYRGS